MKTIHGTIHTYIYTEREGARQRDQSDVKQTNDILQLQRRVGSDLA